MDIGEGSRPPKRQRKNDEEDVEEESLLEKVALHGESDKGKASFMVRYDGPSSSDFSEVSQAISINRAEVGDEIKGKNRSIREKLWFELSGYVDKYHTQLTAELDMDKEQLLMAMTEAIPDPEARTTSYRALEVAMNMSRVPPIDKCNLFKCFSNMLKDEVVKLSLTLRRLQTKYNQVVENLRIEKTDARVLSNDLRSLQAAVKGKGTSKVDPEGHFISELQKQVAALKHKLNKLGFQHVQTTKLAHIEKYKSDLADSLAKEKEERAKIKNEMGALKQERDEL